MDEFNIALTIVIGVVVLGALALWLGRKIKISRTNEGFSLETDAEVLNKKSNDIIVGEGLEITNTKVGDIAGIKSNNTESSELSEQNINVLNSGKIRDSNVKDIVGIKTDKKTLDNEK
jgi:hypothetical protein